VGDEPPVAPARAARLVELAGTEPSVAVRAQLACTAQRLSAAAGLDVAGRLLLRDLDGDDPHLPLLLWWAIERHAVAAVDSTVARFSTPEAWRSGLIRKEIQGRLVRRLASEGTAECDAACARLLASAPDREARGPLIAALDEAMRGRQDGTVAPALSRAAIGMADDDPGDPALTRLAARLGSRPAAERVRAVAVDRRAAVPMRLAMIELMGERSDPASVVVLAGLATGDDPDAVRAAALNALGRFDDPAIAGRLLAAYPRQGAGVAGRGRARSCSAARRGPGRTWPRSTAARCRPWT